MFLPPVTPSGKDEISEDEPSKTPEIALADETKKQHAQPLKSSAEQREDFSYKPKSKKLIVEKELDDEERVSNEPKTQKPEMRGSASPRSKQHSEDGVSVATMTTARSRSEAAPATNAWRRIPTRAGTLYSNGSDIVIDQQTCLTGSTGSKQEVAQMMALAKMKGWNPTQFSGSDAFKAEVVKAALERGYEVKAFTDRDKQLIDDVKNNLPTRASI